MQHLKNTNCNYLQSLGKLKPVDDCKQEGIPFIEIAQMHLGVGCNIIYPTEQMNQKNPDIKVINPITGDTFYIEASKLGDSQERKNLDANHEILLDVFEFEGYQLPYSCSQLR